MAFAAAVRHSLVILALVLTAAIFFGGGDTRATTGEASVSIERATGVTAPSDYFQSGAAITAAKTLAKTPCKRPKVSVHHSCQICHQHLFIRPVSRTRSVLPAPKLKFVVIDTIADRLALASAQAATRLVLASDSILKSSSASSEVIARSARLRN